MKKQLVNFPIIIICLLVLAGGCMDDSELDELRPTEKYLLTTEDYSFYADEEKYEETNTRRTKVDFCRIDFQIQRVQRKGNELAIHVSKPKNCFIRYEIIWDGILMESFPMQAHIFIRAVGEDCGSEEFETGVLMLELEKAFHKMSPSDIGNTDFIVRDACSMNNFSCSNDCDVPVSSP